MKSSSPDEWAGGGDFLQAENPAGQDSFYDAHFLFYTKNRLYIEDDDIILFSTLEMISKAGTPWKIRKFRLFL